MIKNQRGTALLETLVCSKALLVFFGIILINVYVWVAVYWADFWSYRAMVCLLPETTPHRCESLLRERLQMVIPRSHFTVEELWKTSRKTSVAVRIHLLTTNTEQTKLPLFQHFSYVIQKEISLPLTREVLLSP